jgi:hypothetical protein
MKITNTERILDELSLLIREISSEVYKLNKNKKLADELISGLSDMITFIGDD